MELEEIQNKLDILREIPNNPELILTSVFSRDSKINSILYGITIDGKYLVDDYLSKYLCDIKLFDGCVIKPYSCSFLVYVSSLPKISGYLNNLIVDVDMGKHTFELYNGCINHYENVMSEKYELEVDEMDSRLKPLSDLSVKNRIKQIKRIIHGDENLHTKISDVCFLAVMTKKRRTKIQKMLDREYEKLNYSNKCKRERYEENIKRQEYYKEFAPYQIKLIKDKQQEIKKYLEGFGYQQIGE